MTTDTPTDREAQDAIYAAYLKAKEACREIGPRTREYFKKKLRYRPLGSSPTELLYLAYTSARDTWQSLPQVVRRAVQNRFRKAGGSPQDSAHPNAVRKTSDYEQAQVRELIAAVTTPLDPYVTTRCCLAPVPGGCDQPVSTKNDHGWFCQTHSKRLSRGTAIDQPNELLVRPGFVEQGRALVSAHALRDLGYVPHIPKDDSGDGWCANLPEDPKDDDEKDPTGQPGGE